MRTKQTARKSVGPALKRPALFDDGLRPPPEPAARDPRDVSSTWQKSEWSRQSEAVEDHLKGLQAAATALSQACEVARLAQQALQQQAGNMDVLVNATEEATGFAPHVVVAMQEAQAAFSQHTRTLKAVGRAADGASSAIEEGIRELKSALWLPPAALVSIARVWNQQHSLLLNLPETVLHTIVRKSGHTARVACHQLANAYGPPGTTLDWNVGGCPGSRTDYAALAAQLLHLIRTWRWRGQLVELRLCRGVAINLQTRRALPTLLPHLHRLTISTNSALSKSTAQPPAWKSLTALTCRVPDDTSVALPYTMSSLRRLELALPENVKVATQVNLAAALRPLTTLTHLCLLTTWGTQPVQQQDVVDALRALSGSLVSLRLSGARQLLFEHITVLTELRLQSLAMTVSDRSTLYRGMGMLPLLRGLPHLRHLHLADGHTTVEDLRGLVAAVGSACLGLQSLVLPRLVYDSAEAAAALGSALQSMWQHPAVLLTLTSLSLSLSVSSHRPIATNIQPPWLAGVERLQQLQHVALAADALGPGQLSCLQPLAALTHLELRRCDPVLHNSTQFTFNGAVELRHLTQLRKLTVAVVHPARHSRHPSLLRCITEAAALPGLMELDIAGLGELSDDHQGALQALLRPGCGVQRLVVHCSTAGAWELTGTDYRKLYGLKQDPRRPLAAAPAWLGAEEDEDELGEEADESEEDEEEVQEEVPGIVEALRELQQRMEVVWRFVR